MKLQVNTNGAWKHLVDFDQSRREEVLTAVRVLADALGPSNPKWSFVDDKGERQWLEVE